MNKIKQPTTNAPDMPWWQFILWLVVIIGGISSFFLLLKEIDANAQEYDQRTERIQQ